MLLRALVGFSLLCSVFLSGGCSHCRKYVGAPAPAMSLCHGSRLSNELRWLYADINDMVFGVDYYPSQNKKYGDSPYY